jgi:RHS repeat-associated protein
MIYAQQIHTQSNGTAIPTLHLYKYDNANRLLEEWQKNANDAPIVLSRKKFNEIGLLAEKDVHALNSCGTFLQSMDYNYNTRGWLTGINNMAFSNQGNGVGASNNDANDLWALELAYTTPTVAGISAQYNGNIAEKRWKSATDNIARYYDYSYDKLSRLVNGKYNELITAPTTFGNTDRYKEGDITYDENGNILTLTRAGYLISSTFGTMDQLTYAYNGNQLNTVYESSAVQGYNDFKDGNTSSTDYFYDANGNIIQDKNKGITITYNRFNLPELITFSGNRTIQYIYASDGTKLRKKVNNNGSITNTWYCGKFTYNDAGVESFFTSEGRAVSNGAATPKYRYEYQYKDQLGNVSLTFSDLNNNGIIEKTSEVVQQTSYYPFGMDFYGTNYTQIGVVNKFKFTGKELQDDFGLNLYDYGARFYDVQLGRWYAVDPMVDVYPHWSPYNYVCNNPVKLIDPMGLAPEEPEVNKTSSKDNNSNAFTTRFVNPNGRTILNTNDGRDDVYMVPWDRLYEFKENAYWNHNRTDWVEWNDHWRDQLEQIISEAKLKRAGYYGLHSEEAKEASVKYLVTGGLVDYQMFVNAERSAQWSDKVLVAGCILACGRATVGAIAMGGGQSLGAGRTATIQWLKNVGNLERGTLIQNIESAGFKRMSPTTSPVSVFERGGMRIRLDPPQSGTPFNHMHLEYGGNSYDISLNPVNYKSPAAHIPTR